MINSSKKFNLIKFDLSLTKEIEMYRNIPPIDIKNKIITIGFYDVIYCDRIWRRIKKGYFYELPKYTNKFRWVFLAKNGVDSNCNKYTHLTFRRANNLQNLIMNNMILHKTKRSMSSSINIPRNKFCNRRIYSLTQ